MKPTKSPVAPLQRPYRGITMPKKRTVKVINGITHVRSRLDDGPRWIPVRVPTKRK